MTGSIESNKSTIPFTVTVEETDDKFDAAIAGTNTQSTKVKGSVTSNGTKTTDLVSYTQSDIIGDYRYCSAKLTVSSDADLKGVMMDTYTATITLTATSL